MRNVLLTLVLMLLLFATAAAQQDGLSLRLTVYNPQDGPVRLFLRAENLTSQPLSLAQANGQTHEFAVQQGEQVVWRWSSDKFFLEALQDLVIAPGETRVFEGEWNRTDEKGQAVAPGRYTVLAWIPRRGAEPIVAQPRELVITSR